MLVEPITDPADLQATLGWYAGWLKVAPPADWLGVVWWVRGLAACTCLVTDGPRVYLEDLISNPESDARERSEAIDALEAHVVAIAARLGKRYVVSSSSNVSVLARAKRLGWAVTDAKKLLIRKVPCDG